MDNASPRFAAVIFDMDGVLIDSEEMYLKELLAFSDCYGLGETRELASQQVGASHQDFQRLCKRLLEGAGVGSFTPEEAERFYERWAEGRKRDYLSVVFPGAVETIDALLAAGVRVALASSSPRAMIDYVLESLGIADRFERVVSGEQFRQSKPDPEIYLHSVEALGLTPAQCCCVEDSVPGIAAGKAAGLMVFARREERFGFSQDEADVIIDTLPELLPHVLNV